MSEGAGATSSALTAYLDGAYRRILRLALALTALAVAGSTAFSTWSGTLMLAVGAMIGILNLVWLHRGAHMMVDRMLAGAASRPSKLRVALFFPLRYLLMIAAVYAILKGYRGALVSFIVGLALPIMALIGESAYEALVLGRTNRP